MNPPEEMKKFSPEIWRWPRLSKEIGLSRATVWRKIKEGTFPKPMKITANLVGWRRADIEEWLYNLKVAV